MDLQQEGWLTTIKELKDFLLEQLHGERVCGIALTWPINYAFVHCGARILALVMILCETRLGLANILPEVIDEEHFCMEDTLLVLAVDCLGTIPCGHIIIVELPLQRHED